MSYPKILLRPGKEHILGHLHPWIFSQALQTPEKIKNGELVDICGSDGGKFLARGYYNGNSQIAVRILTRSEQEEISTAFFEKRFQELKKIRERFILGETTFPPRARSDIERFASSRTLAPLPFHSAALAREPTRPELVPRNDNATNAFRLVFGESDGLPGLIIDQYDRVLVIQIHTLGMEMLRKEVLAAMKSVFDPETIFERSDVGVRLQEGLKDMPIGLLYGKKPNEEIQILENGIPLWVNVEAGQKTGLFLDQRENRKALQKYVLGMRVLNCFCYTAGFSVYAALAGAKETINVDVSGEALETAKRNFTLNKIPLKAHQFLDKDVFEVLSESARKNEKFDVIILDPPAFVKNQKSLKKGLSGYLFINEKALGLLPKGGILVSSSCSAHVTDEMFQKTLAMAASRCGCTLKTLEIRHQPIDHPFNVHFPEGKYLKFYVMLKG